MSRRVRFSPTKHLTRRNLLLAGIFLLLVSGFIFLWIATLRLPDMQAVETRRVTQSTKIYDRTGTVLLYDLSQNITRTVIPIGQISPNIQKATVAIEDAEFYQHHGVKPTAYLRAIWVDLITLSFSQGGSTITQQVVKNALLTQDKTAARKIKELILALKLERVLSKDQILEIYLNENPYGGSISGVEEASETFFGKHASDVTLTEAAYLAALPQAPSYFSPYGNHKSELEKRKNLVLDRMLENKFITQDEHDAAKKETSTFLPQKNRSIVAPHFVFYVQEQLEAKYGSRVLEDSGLKVITTLDADMQTKAEEVVKKYALENATKFNASNAALVAIDPRSGDILTMVGSRNYFDTEIPGNFNIALALRQPGSSFKPFVYAAAFEKGYTPDTVLFDVPTQFSTSCEPTDTGNSAAPCYAPQNYDNKFRGPVTLRSALAQSLNIPSVKLLYLTGIDNALSLAKALGVTSLSDAAHYGLTLVLGGGEVRLLDMVSGYGTFAANGYHYNPRAILEVDDGSGTILEKSDSTGEQVMPETIASQINDILSDDPARQPSYGANSALYFGGKDVAAKTGTTNDYRDAWIIGYTPNLVAGAWAGNNDNTPMEKKVAGLIVAPLWHEFMQAAIASRPNDHFLRVENDTASLPPVLRGIWQGGISEQIDTRTGQSANFTTPTEFVQERVSGGVHSILNWINKNDPTGLRPANPQNDSQWRYWEAGVRIWAAANGYSDDTSYTPPSATGLPGVSNPVTTPSNDTVFTIINPTQGSTVPKNELLQVAIKNTKPLKEVTFKINGTSVGSVGASPYTLFVMPSALSIIKDQNTLTADGSYIDGTGAHAEIQFNVQ